MPGEELAKAFDLDKFIDFAPRYNAAPGQDLPVIIKNRIGFARWGFIPEWTNARDIKPQINARLETLTAKPMFAEAARKRRCLVPASGFYEWATSDKGKQPLYIHCTDGAPLAFAGIWSKFEEAEGPQVTFAIVTKPALPAIARIHARMPVMLEPQAGKDWLYADIGTAQKTARNAAPELTAYPVSNRMNRPAEDDADLLTAVSG
jgi:putative SOS response-associated peptidase YedK